MRILDATICHLLGLEKLLQETGKGRTLMLSRRNFYCAPKCTYDVVVKVSEGSGIARQLFFVNHLLTSCSPPSRKHQQVLE